MHLRAIITRSPSVILRAVIPVIKLGKILVKVLFADVLIYSDYTTFEDRKIALYRVCMDFFADDICHGYD